MYGRSSQELHMPAARCCVEIYSYHVDKNNEWGGLLFIVVKYWVMVDELDSLDGTLYSHTKPYLFHQQQI
jgi:hypothetical protein